MLNEFQGCTGAFCVFGTQIATMAVGGIRTATTAECILAEGKADLVAIGREMLRDQSWPLRAAQHFEIDVYHVPQHDWTVNRPSNA